MSRILCVGGVTAGAVAAAALALEKLGQTLVVADEAISNFTLNAYDLHQWEPKAEPMLTPITYGPQRKGKGGKVRRW